MRKRSFYKEAIEKEIDLKRRFKEFKYILDNLYNKERETNNNKLIFLKRSIDKLNNVYKYIISLDILNSFNDEELTLEEDTFKKELSEAYNLVIKDINKINKILKDKHNKEISSKRIGKSILIKRNLDKLIMAQNNLRSLDLALNASRQDWLDLEDRRKK